MLKRALSMLLCLVIVFSCFSLTAIDTLAAYNVKGLFTVQASPVKDGKISYTINITAKQNNIAGIVLYVDFDNTVLNPIKAEPSKTVVSGVEQLNFNGSYYHGFVENNPCRYSIGYTNSVAVSTDSVAKAFFEMEFEVIDETRPLTDVIFYCREYYSTTEAEKNITVSDGLQTIADFSDTKTLEIPNLLDVVPYKEGLKVTWEEVEGAIAYQVYRIIPYDTDGWVALQGATVNAGDALEYYDTGLISGTTYTYAVSAVNYYESGHDTKGDSCMFIAKPVITECANVVGGIQIKWGETKGAAFYNIMRRVQGETEWSKLASRASTLDRKYTDTSVEEGKEYEYDVLSATDTFVSESAATGEKLIYIPAPQIISGANILNDGRNGIEIKWNGVLNGVRYTIYRREIGTDSTLDPYADTDKTSFIDETISAGVSYTYSVQAHTNYGDSGYSMNGYTLTHVPSTNVKSLTLQKDSVKVEWEPVENVNGYAIYRKVKDSTSWVKVASVNKDVIEFDDTFAGSGNQYVYAVTPLIGSYEGAKVQSNPIYFIKAPTNVVAENVKSGIKLTWDSVVGATEYQILKRDVYGDFSEIALIDGDKTEYIDSEDIAYNEFYLYCVKAINPMGNSLQSDVSNELERLGSMGKATPKLYTGGIKVTWEPSSVADKYAVYRTDGNAWTFIDVTEEPQYIDTNVQSDVVYSYAIGMIIGDSRGIVDTEDVSKIRYIAPPQNLKGICGNGAITISWDSVQGATGYELWKADINSEDYKLIATVTKDELSFQDKSVVPGVPYKYVVRAQGTVLTSLDSPVLCAEYLEAPVIQKLTSEFGGVNITWNNITGADEYLICLKVGDGEWEAIDSVDSSVTTYFDESAVNGETSYYAIKARGEYGISDINEKSINYLTAPTLTVSNTKSGVYLKWEKNEAADEYYIYRKTPSAKGWTRINKVTGNTYTDSKVTAGATYIYTIKAVKGTITSAYNKTGWTYRFLKSPTHKSLSNADGAVVFSWNKVAGATGYIVYRKVNGSPTWTNLGKTKGTSYTDKDVENKSNYTYTVRAYYGSSLSAFYTGDVIKYMTAPTLKVANTTAGVKLEWDKVNGASSYYVYRKAGSAKSWTKIATVTRTYYTDSNVKSGTKYTYTIKAYGSRTISGYNKSGWAIYFLKTPKISSAVSKTSGVALKWNKIAGASGYMVYRKVGTGGWEYLGKTTSNSKVTFTDKKAKKGVTYTYTVRAYKGNSKSSFYTNVKCTDKY